MIKSFKKNVVVVGFGLVFLALLLHPLTRPTMLLILPLGSGPDDLIIIVLAVLFVWIWKDIK